VDESTIIIAGIGGQGIQLLSKVLARAALADGRHVMLAAEYGGEMRGGRSFASVVIGAGPLRSLPVIERADVAVVLHEKFWEESAHLLKPDAYALVESAFIDAVIEKSAATNPPQRFAAFDGFDCARQAGSAMGAGLAMLGGLCANLGLARIDSLVEAMTDITPPYRRQHVETNAAAIRGGAARAPRFVAREPVA
jgi:2-oxoglutarate ferredoxin oxidoreductase subunit gamma